MSAAVPAVLSTAPSIADVLSCVLGRGTGLESGWEEFIKGNEPSLVMRKSGNKNKGHQGIGCMRVTLPHSSGC